MAITSLMALLAYQCFALGCPVIASYALIVPPQLTTSSSLLSASKLLGAAATPHGELSAPPK